MPARPVGSERITNSLRVVVAITVISVVCHTAPVTKCGASTTEASSRGRRHPLANVTSNFDNAWVRNLSPETPSNRAKSRRAAGHARDDGVSNDVQRPVHNGHYVLVKPKPLKNPRLVIHSPDVAAAIGLTENDVRSEEFLRYVSGDVASAFDGVVWPLDDGSNYPPTWSTPYALSIMGRRYTSNCPYGTGDGYGDGRAISVGEVLFHDHDRSSSSSSSSPFPSGDYRDRYELQLKGAGPTPFCRGGDGRAVLRSSVREFLASESMHRLGISTTRALSLVVSDGPDGDVARRPWYSDGGNGRTTTGGTTTSSSSGGDDGKADPDVLIEEPCAVTCRASRSYVRVGHLDIFARRVSRTRDGSYDTSARAWDELVGMMWHAVRVDFKRECHDPYRPPATARDDPAGAAECLLERSLDAMSTTVAGWIRVGFAQGNFNADNCLVSGRTVDYGPFGFMDEYHPLFAKWTASGDHFGFMRQPTAGEANFNVLADSVAPIMEAYGEKGATRRFRMHIAQKARAEFRRKVAEVFRSKLGFHPDDDAADALWNTLETLMGKVRVDWTLFWRQLTTVATNFPITEKAPPSVAYDDMLELLRADDRAKEGSSPFYGPLSDDQRALFVNWIRDWRMAIISSRRCTAEASNSTKSCVSPEERMRLSNPKYTLREWMLVEAYTKASPWSYRSSTASTFPPVGVDGEGGLTAAVGQDESVIHELYDLIQNPYDEGTDRQDRRFYRRAPDEALRAGGTAFMS